MAGAALAQDHGLCANSLFFLVFTVLRGSGSTSGASDYGTGAPGECSGSLSPGRHALSAGILPGQKCRFVLTDWSRAIEHDTAKDPVSP